MKLSTNSVAGDSAEADGRIPAAFSPPPLLPCAVGLLYLCDSVEAMNTHSLNWTARFLSPPETSTGKDRIARTLWALGLTAFFGLAMGAREGGTSLLTHAAGVPLAAVAICFLGLPALYIVLSLCSAPVSLQSLGDASSKALAQASVVLAGLAPATALFVVTSDNEFVAAGVAFGGLFLGGAIGLRSFLVELNSQLAEATPRTRFMGSLATVAFAIFSVALASRVWGSTLALLGGA